MGAQWQREILELATGSCFGNSSSIIQLQGCAQVTGRAPPLRVSGGRPLACVQAWSQSFAHNRMLRLRRDPHNRRVCLTLAGVSPVGRLVQQPRLKPGFGCSGMAGGGTASPPDRGLAWACGAKEGCLRGWERLAWRNFTIVSDEAAGGPPCPLARKRGGGKSCSSKKNSRPRRGVAGGIAVGAVVAGVAG